ncbi:MAG: MFS transporter, partial [Acidiferrobacterales bacterium]|nr:MFS transporter [Acidiferrobacterales bacterium]
LLISVLATPAWIAFLLLAPLGVVAQGSTTITYGLVVDMVHPKRIARGYAIMYGSTGFAAAAGPWLFGMVGDWLGIRFSLLAIALVSLLAIPAMLLLRQVEPDLNP